MCRKAEKMLDQQRRKIMSNNTITVTGIVATEPRHLITAEGLHITSFRMASTARRYDRTTEKWVDGPTNWFTVTSFRSLATNVARSVSKGDHLVVEGALRIREWENGERNGTTVELEAEVIGHDLAYGTAIFTRTVPAVSVTDDTAHEA
jgi:single-strand DNA-binding protein